MLEARHQISTAQFFVMMFVSRAAVTLTLNVRSLGGRNMLDSIPAYFLSMALGGLIALPILVLDRKYPGRNVCDAAQELWGPVGKVVPAVYAAYFILVNGASLGLFHIFLSDTLNPDFSAALTVALLLLAALYGAFRGVEAVARCSACVFALMLAGVALVFGVASFRFRSENLEPLFADGFSQLGESVLLFIARTSIFADMAVLLPMVRGKKGKGFLAWAGGTALFVSLVLFLVQGCLGRYASTQDFPVHTLSSMTEIRSMQRLDVVFVSVWILGLTVKLACDIYACRVCFSSISGKRRPGLSVALSGFLILLLAYAMAGNNGVRELLINRGFLFGCTAAVGLLPPLLVWGGTAIRERGKRE